MTTESCPPGDPGPGPVVTVEQVTWREGSVELILRVHNPRSDRALHYISDPRRITIDLSGAFVVRLSDQGRQVIPAAVDRLPVFARVDPDATALLTLRIPDRIVRLRVGPTPSAEAELEEHPVSPDSVIDVVIGWSDEPYYPDPRDPQEDPVVRWEKGQVRVPVTGEPGPTST